MSGGTKNTIAAATTVIVVFLAFIYWVAATRTANVSTTEVQPRPTTTLPSESVTSTSTAQSQATTTVRSTTVPQSAVIWTSGFSSNYAGIRAAYCTGATGEFTVQYVYEADKDFVACRSNAMVLALNNNFLMAFSTSTHDIITFSVDGHSVSSSSETLYICQGLYPPGLGLTSCDYDLRPSSSGNHTILVRDVQATPEVDSPVLTAEIVPAGLVSQISNMTVTTQQVVYVTGQSFTLTEMGAVNVASFNETFAFTVQVDGVTVKSWTYSPYQCQACSYSGFAFLYAYPQISIYSPGTHQVTITITDQRGSKVSASTSVTIK